MDKERIIAVGFLTSADLAMLGERFDRYFPVEHEEAFSNLLSAIDEADAARRQLKGEQGLANED